MHTQGHAIQTDVSIFAPVAIVLGKWYVANRRPAPLKLAASTA